MVEIIRGIHQVDGVNANSYLISNEDGSLILIDASMSKDGKKILDYIGSKMSKKPSDVKTIVLTHSHIDHVRGTYALKKATGAKVAIHELDADYLSRKKNMPRPKGFVGIIFGAFSPMFKFTAVDPDIRLKENDIVGGLKVLHAPGHTPGSIALYDGSRKLMFVGDTLSYRNGKIEGPPKAFTPDMEQAMKSIQKIAGYDFEIMLSGHGDPLTTNANKKIGSDLGLKNPA